MSTRIFITGLSSALGRHLLVYLSRDSFSIKALSRTKKANAPNLTWIRGDLMNPSSYSKALSDCDILLHMAGITHSTNPEAYFEVNYKSSINLFENAKRAGVKHIIYLSSYTAGEKSGAYGQSKYQTEKYLAAEFNNWSIVRPSEIFGSEKSEGIDKLVQNLQKKRIHFYPEGVKLKLKPIFIEDAAGFLYLILSRSEFNRKMINITGPEALDIKNILNYAQICRKTRFSLIPVPRNFMFILEKFLRLMPIPLGLAPDQIPRLYRPKEQLKTNKELVGETSFLQYLARKLEN